MRQARNREPAAGADPSRNLVDERVVGLAGAAQSAFALVDLLLPGGCAGCGGPAGWRGMCAGCLGRLHQGAVDTRPTPAPPGLPPCLALGRYDGEIREMILAYKERGRRRLAAPLGEALGTALAGCLPERDMPVVLVGVPGTAKARRERFGDHMRRVTRHARRRLRRDGFRVVCLTPLRARPKADSAHLDRLARARSAEGAFDLVSAGVRRLRAEVGQGALIVLVDDVITTGATLASMAHRLAGVGAPPALAITLAATHLRRLGPLDPIGQISLDRLARQG